MIGVIVPVSAPSAAKVAFTDPRPALELVEDAPEETLFDVSSVPPGRLFSDQPVVTGYTRRMFIVRLVTPRTRRAAR